MDIRLPYIITDGGKWKLRPVQALLWITILISHGTGTPVRAPQAVQTDHEETGCIKSLSWAAQEWTPPICDIRTTAQSVTDHQGVVSGLGQLTSGGIGHWDIVQRNTRFQGKRRDRNERLIRNEL
jgi:hypothetical protein